MNELHNWSQLHKQLLDFSFLLSVFFGSESVWKTFGTSVERKAIELASAAILRSKLFLGEELQQIGISLE